MEDSDEFELGFLLCPLLEKEDVIGDVSSERVQEDDCDGGSIVNRSDDLSSLFMLGHWLDERCRR